MSMGKQIFGLNNVRIQVRILIFNLYEKIEKVVYIIYI